MQAEVEDLLQRAGEHGRDLQRGERRLAGARQRRGLAARVVADEREHAAGGGGAGEVRVADRVHRAIEPRVLAVPDADHAVVLRVGQPHRELRPVDGGRGELLVEAGDEVQEVLSGDAAQAHDLLVQAAEGRALVAGGERGRAYAAARV